jgi:hypothetical protein
MGSPDGEIKSADLGEPPPLKHFPGMIEGFHVAPLETGE